MRLLMCVALWLGVSAAAQADGIQLFMRDGQLKTQAVRLFVTERIDSDMAPVLQLQTHHWLLADKCSNRCRFPAQIVAPNQSETVPVNGQRVPLSGTLLLFDLHGFDIRFFKPAPRVTPVIEWCPQGVEAGTGTERRCKDVTERVLGSASVNIGNPSGVYLWTLLLMLSLLALIGWMSLQASRKNGEKGSSFYLLRGVDGGLSLSRSQVAAWTVAVAGVVFGHGLVRLEIPEIPDSLLVLMGLSLATGGISYAQTRGAAQPERPQRHFELWDLICASEKDGTVTLSIAKAQMLIWTVIVLCLFIIKSILEGVVWEVPWEMVTLMGLSQAGYLSPIVIPSSPSSK